ncbi:MAG: PTS sugar transporter subunit IIA [Thermodesulfobacteriota bacterium]
MEPPLKLHKLIRPERICFLNETQRVAAIERLVDHACRLGLAKDRKAFEAAVLERERITTTGIGMGAAIPHARLAGVSDFFIILGVAANPVIWNAADGLPVTTIFLVCGPETPSGDREKSRLATLYLRIIARLMLLIKSPLYREGLTGANRADAIFKLIREFDNTDGK